MFCKVIMAAAIVANAVFTLSGHLAAAPAVALPASHQAAVYLGPPWG
jgi:hypothetical protein